MHGAGRRAFSYACVIAGLGLAAAGCASERNIVAAAHEAGSVLSRGSFATELLITGEIQAVRSIEIKAPQTSIFQMRIQFMADEGSEVVAGDPVLDFDNSTLASQARELETQILDAETQIVARKAELASALKDLEIELAERRYDFEWAKLEASVDPEVLSRKEHAERQLAFTQATRELAETEERIRLTRSRGEADLDVLKINRDKLRKDLLLAQEELGRLSIEAPSDGLVVYEVRPQSTLRFQEGDSCWPGQTVIQLPDLSEMRAIFWVNEVDAPRLEVDVPVEIELDAYPGRKLGGRIARIPSMAVKRDGNSKIAVFKVEAELDETWVGEMKPGMSVLGHIGLEQRADVPRVAREAVRFDGEKYWYRAPDSASGEREVEIDPVSRNAKFYVISEEAFAALGGPTAKGPAIAATPGGAS